MEKEIRKGIILKTITIMMYFITTTTIIVIIAAISNLATDCYAEPCSYTAPSGVKYDFTKVSNKDISITADGYTYALNICGTSATECPNDPDGVTSGMAVQTQPNPFGPKCYVLSQYDDSVTEANWSPLIGTPHGVSLTLAKW